MVCAHLGDKLTILDARTDEGLHKTEEIFSLLERFAADYRPNLVIVEYDAQQKGIGNDDRLAAMGKHYGFTVRPHLTRGKKMDAVFGVASMDQSFKAGDIRIPYGDQLTQDRMIPLLNQLRSWRPDIATKHLTQDLVMALWFVWRVWIKTKVAHAPAPPAPAWRPSWVMTDPRRVN